MPPQTLSWKVDCRDGVVTATVDGTLDARSGRPLHRILAAWSSRAPVAILVDLTAATVVDEQAAQALTNLTSHADAWPGSPILLCGPEDPDTSLVYATAADVAATVAGDTAPRSEFLLPVPGAARQARNVVTDACVRWGLPHLTGPATVVASELVSNVVMHAHTVMTLEVRLRPDYLFVAVFDEGYTVPEQRTNPPDAPGGRGLQLVDILSARWGYRRQRGGKVVWASFPRT